MASHLSILRRSACSEGTKVATAVSKFHRRWKNTDLYSSREAVEKVSLDYSDMLTANGYGVEWKRKVIMKALIGYERIMKLVREGKTKRNRTGKDTILKRRVKRLTGQSDWFRKERRKLEEEIPGGRKKERKREVPKKSKKADNVFFIPFTRNSELQKRLQK